MFSAMRRFLAASGLDTPTQSGKVCLALASASILCALVVLFRYGTGGRMAEVDPNEIRHFHTAKVMLLPAMLLEGCYLISSRSRFVGLALKGTEMSAFVVVEYTVKMLCYSTMAYFNGGIVNINMRAMGGPRGCYTFRYLEWSIAVPTLVALNNYPLWNRKGLPAMGRALLPQILATVSYVFGNWVAQVTPVNAAGWALICLSFCSYLSTVFDQKSIIASADRNLMGFRFKVGAIIVKEVVFVTYAVVNLLGVANVVSSETEQLFYTIGDVLLKVLQASILVVVRNWEALSELSQALQRKVEAGREDMSRLFHQAHAPIFTMTREGTVVAWNEHLARTSGVAENSAVGTSIFDLANEESCAGLRTAIDCCVTGVSSGCVEISLKSGKADEQPMQMLLTLISQHSEQSADRAGASDAPGVTITAIGQDLTEVMAMKQTQMRKTQITAVLGHELRSPLHGIMGLSASMAEGTSNQMQKRQLTMIKGCATRMLDLVTNIMEMAKAEKAEGEGIEKRHVNMMDIIDEVVGMTDVAVDKNGRRLIGSNVMMINSMCTGKLPMVFGDSYKITQVFYNLVTNAAKFTASGSIQLSAREDEAEGMLEIDVTDTGKGIKPEAVATIFEPFRQEENKDSRSFQGIGLGLSVAVGITKAHGGSIRVASKFGQGSTFTVCLPCDFGRRAGLTLRCEEGIGGATSRAARQIAAQSKSVAPPGGVEAPAGQRPLILSVDDDDINQEVIEQTLGSEYRIVRAMNGYEAFEYLESGKEFPSLVLLDVMMPGPSGFEVVAQLRNKRSLTHSQLPVVMLSARSPQDGTASEAFRSGATDYMQKPFSSVILKHRLSVIDEVRQEIRNAQVLAVEYYKTEVQQSQPTSPDASPSAPQQWPALSPPEKDVHQAAEKEAGRRVARLAEDAAGGEGEGRAVAADLRKRLEEERDALRSRLEAVEAQALQRLGEEREASRRRLEAFEAKAGREARQLAEERDRLRLELASMAPQAEEPKGWATQATSAELLADRAARAELQARFFKDELEMRDRQLSEMREKAARKKTSAWVANHRADALDRELRFIQQLGRVRQLAF